MIALDTNVLLRVLVDDPEAPEQNTAARALAKQSETVFVPLITIVETVWVLETAYRCKRIEVIQILDHLYNNRAFVLDQRDIFAAALNYYRSETIDFADGIIVEGVSRRGLLLYTFDRRLGRLENVSLVGN